MTPDEYLQLPASVPLGEVPGVEPTRCGGEGGRVAFETLSEARRDGVRTRRRLAAAGLDRGTATGPEGRLTTWAYECGRCGAWHWSWRRHFAGRAPVSGSGDGSPGPALGTLA